MRTGCVAWSREQLDFLTDHYGKPGWTARRIADAMPGDTRTVTSVHKKAQSLGITSPEQRGGWKHDKAMHEDVYDLAVLDYTDIEIADAINSQYGTDVTRKWVRDVLQKYVHSLVYKNWQKRMGERRSRTNREAYAKRRRVA